MCVCVRERFFRLFLFAASFVLFHFIVNSFAPHHAFPLPILSIWSLCHAATHAVQAACYIYDGKTFVYLELVAAAPAIYAQHCKYCFSFDHFENAVPFFLLLHVRAWMLNFQRLRPQFELALPLHARSLSMHIIVMIIMTAQMEFHILSSFFSVVAFYLAYIYGVQNGFYYFRTGTQHGM